VPEGLAERVIKVSDLGVPIAAAMGRWSACSDVELRTIVSDIWDEMDAREGTTTHELVRP